MRLPSPVYSDGLRKSTQVRFYGYDARGVEGGICYTENMTSDYCRRWRLAADGSSSAQQHAAVLGRVYVAENSVR